MTCGLTVTFLLGLLLSSTPGLRGQPPAPRDLGLFPAPTLGSLLKGAKHVAVLEVVSVDRGQRLVSFKKAADLKGDEPADPERVKDSKESAAKQKLTDKVEFRQGDVLKVKDLKDATVVLLYMGDDVNELLKPVLKGTLKPGSRVVSHRFAMGDWKPDKSETFDGEDGGEYTIHLWTIK